MTAHPPHLSHPKYRPDIDGLRAIAVLSVVTFHAFPEWLPGGFTGVDVFFVISGYLISTIIYENLERGTFSFSEFYERRIKRIFPALILVLGATYAFGWFALLGDEYKQLGKHIAAGAGFFSNYALWTEAGYFDNSAETKPLLHLWSLGIEEQFYILWPLLLWFGWKRKSNLLAITVLVAILSLYLNIKGISKDVVATFFSPQTRFWELFSGGLLAWFVLHRRRQRTEAQALGGGAGLWLQGIGRDTLPSLLSLTGLLVLLCGFWFIDKSIGFPGKWALVPVLGAVLIIAGGNTAFVNRHILANRVAVWFGLISFPLYLWHWPLLSFARIVESDSPGVAVRAAAVALSVLLAWLTYRYVERPFRFGEYAKAKSVLVVTMVVFGLVGAATYAGDGFPRRSSVREFTNNKHELVRMPAKDDACLEFVHTKSPRFAYCRFTDVGSTETVAVIGDSHAHVAYPGIAEHLKNSGINTVLLANSSCPPLIGVPILGQTEAERLACKASIDELLEVVLSRKEIHRVFFIARGPIYFTGTEPLTGERDVMNGKAVTPERYRDGTQRTIDRLAAGGKQVFYVLENPELATPAESCVGRPFRAISKVCAPDKQAVLIRQETYLKMVRSLAHATLIESLETFCPMDTCRVFDENGTLMYADDDHLSVAGSRFQVRHRLAAYLDARNGGASNPGGTP